MAITTKMTSMTPVRERMKKEITLVSGGYSSPLTFPAGKITVYPWDNVIDDYLYGRARTGSKDTVLFDLIPKVCNLNGCSVDQFVVGDVNTVLLTSRAMLRDSVVKVDATCPACNTKFVQSLNVPDQLEKVGEKSEGYPGFDVVTLPVCQDVLKIRPLTIGDEKSILNRTDLRVSDRVAHIMAGIVSINETRPDTPEELVIWLAALHPKDFTFLEQSQDKIIPRLSDVVTIGCESESCNHSFKVQLNLDLDFFRPEFS